MSNLIFPTVRSLTFPVKKTAEYNNLDTQAQGGQETRYANWNNPIWHFDLEYTNLRDDPNDFYLSNPDTDYRMIQGFNMGRKGIFDDFLFLDPTDNRVALGPLQLLEDDNGTWYSPIQRNMGGIVSGGFEDITDLVGGNINASIALFEDGSPSATTSNVFGGGIAVAGLAFEGAYVVWNSEPTPPITATFNFYFRVRFETDGDLEFEQNFGAPVRYSLKSLKLMTSRIPTTI